MWVFVVLLNIILKCVIEMQPGQPPYMWPHGEGATFLKLAAWKSLLELPDDVSFGHIKNTLRLGWNLEQFLVP